MNFKEDFKLKKAVTLPQIQCLNCKGYKTISDSKKQHSLATGGVFFFLGILFNLFFILIIGIPLVVIGIIIMLIVNNTMTDDGSMKCRTCHFQFKTNP